MAASLRLNQSTFRLSAAFWCVLLVIWETGCFSLGSRGKSLPDIPASPGKPPVFQLPALQSVLIPDTSDTFWWLRSLAIFCGAIGVLAIVASFFAWAVSPTLVLIAGRVRLAGFGCVLLAIGMAALQRFMQAYLGIVMFGTLLMGLAAAALWLIPYGRWLVERAFQKRTRKTIVTAESLVKAGDTRAGVALLTNVIPELEANPDARKHFLRYVEAGHPTQRAFEMATGKSMPIPNPIELAKDTVDAAKAVVGAIKAAPESAAPPAGSGARP